MNLLKALQNLFRKSPEKASMQPGNKSSISESPNPAGMIANSPQERIQKNMEKASSVALEIDVLRSKLPRIMSFAPVERLRKIDAELAETEAALKGAKVATADLGNTDEFAINALRELEPILSDSGRETEASDALSLLNTALRDDWFSNDANTIRRLRRKLSGLLVQESLAKLNQQITGLKEWARKDAGQLRALMDAGSGSADHNAEILRLSNHIKSLKLGIDGKEALKTELSTIQDALTYSLQYAAGISSDLLVQKEGEAAQAEITEELQAAAEKKSRITEQLIRDKVNVDVLSRQMAESGIALSNTADLKDLISEFIDPEEILLNPETVPLAEKTETIHEYNNENPMMA